MTEYHVHVDYGEDDNHTVRVTSVDEAKELAASTDGDPPSPKVLLEFEFKHPINSQLAKDARREALKRMAER